jgi:selenocysteine lyase/cysteine desulfurase
MAHSHELLRGCGADAICFSAHKMYAASLGVIVIRKDLLQTLTHNFVGGGMVSAVRENDFDLLPDDLSSRLEPGLQAFGEIIAFRAALQWLETVKPHGLSRSVYIQQLSEELYTGLKALPGVTMINQAAAPVISLYSDRYDAHRLAVFLSAANIMVRSGYFCCHYYLRTQRNFPPLIRFSLGLQTTSQDVQTTLTTLKKIIGKA